MDFNQESFTIADLNEYAHVIGNQAVEEYGDTAILAFDPVFMQSITDRTMQVIEQLQLENAYLLGLLDKAMGELAVVYAKKVGVEPEHVVFDSEGNPMIDLGDYPPIP